MILALALISIVVIRIYEGWHGAVSVRHFTKDRYHEAAPLLAEGLFEAKRVLKRAPPLQIHTQDQTQNLPTALEQPQTSLAWHMQARDLISLRYPNYVFDKDQDWHDEERCWIGSNRKSSSVVAVRCDTHELSHNQVVRFVEYVARIQRKRGASPLDLELILAIRIAGKKQVSQVLGYNITHETESSLLEGLVDFTDYFADIRRRVERHSLPDSSLTLKDVYTPSSCKKEDGSFESNIEEYLNSWLSEPGSRQLALLGEYGQGKSTAALMTTYHLIDSRDPIHKIPILIELRGKSPRNMTPEEIIAGWAFPYSINPLAVMKLLMAGRIFLILEGFDEMALVGDSETRLAHFRTLWKFCYQNSKILITGRPNFFLDDYEMKASLGISKPTAAGPYCDALRLIPFTIDQIKLALRSLSPGVAGEIVELAKRDSKFREIVSRGSLLYVVSQLWIRDKLSQQRDRITSALVMDLFIQHSYRRQTEKVQNSPDFMILNESERKYFMEGIAAWMGASELPNQITREQFEKAVKTLYELIPEVVSHEDTGFPKQLRKPLRKRLDETEDPIANVANDVRSSGILVVDESKVGALRFAHKSFMEYLMAKAYGNHITRQKRDASSAIMTASHLGPHQLLDHPETLSFLAEIFLGSLPASDLSARTIAKSLFDLIVVRSRTRNIFQRIGAAMALHDLKVRAKLKGLSKSGNGHWIKLLFASRAYSFLILMLAGAVMGIQVAVLNLSNRGQHTPIHFGALSLLMVLLVLSQSIWISDIRNGAAVKLWFICCVVVGLSVENIEMVTGPKWAVPIANYLDISSKLKV